MLAASLGAAPDADAAAAPSAAASAFLARWEREHAPHFAEEIALLRTAAAGAGARGALEPAALRRWTGPARFRVRLGPAPLALLHAFLAEVRATLSLYYEY